MKSVPCQRNETGSIGSAGSKGRAWFSSFRNNALSQIKNLQRFFILMRRPFPVEPVEPNEPFEPITV